MQFFKRDKNFYDFDGNQFITILDIDRRMNENGIKDIYDNFFGGWLAISRKNEEVDVINYREDIAYSRNPLVACKNYINSNDPFQLCVGKLDLKVRDLVKGSILPALVYDSKNNTNKIMESAGFDDQKIDFLASALKLQEEYGLFFQI